MICTCIDMAQQLSFVHCMHVRMAAHRLDRYRAHTVTVVVRFEVLASSVFSCTKLRM